MHKFLSHNRDELIARCKAKVAKRPQRSATAQQLANGIPMFLEQLTNTLQAEEDGDLREGARISGASGGDTTALSQIGVTAAAHGKELMELGYTVDQVVHDYGDLCQSISDLAVERDAPFSTDQFRTLNRCLDNARSPMRLRNSAASATPVCWTGNPPRRTNASGFLSTSCGTYCKPRRCRTALSNQAGSLLGAQLVTC